VSRRILIADNDEEVRNGLKPLLSNAGYTTLFAVDGIGLIEQARKHQPHLVMIDFCLPAGNAIVLVQTLRRFPEFARTPIFIFGAREYRTSASQVFDSGANAFLPKPFNRQVLFSLIARFLPSETNINSLNLVQGVDSWSRQPTNSSRVFFD
jgi:two-component system alkaline phosphatase synthesis response regulator PhoP